MIIGLLNQKSGVGKTTICVNLAAAFAAAGRKVLLVDADPQGSALAWSSLRNKEPSFPVIGIVDAMTSGTLCLRYDNGDHNFSFTALTLGIADAACLGPRLILD